MQLALSNVDPDTATEVVVEVYDEVGAPVLDLFDSGLIFEVPPLGSRVLRSSGTGSIRRGWIQVRTGADSVSGLLTYKEGTTGIEVSVEPAELGERFALFVEESDDVGAGVAVFKPEAPPSIQLRVRDAEGNDPLEGAFVSRGNFHQLARTLPEWLGAGGVDTGFLSDGFDAGEVRVPDWGDSATLTWSSTNAEIVHSLRGRFAIRSALTG